MWNLTLLAADLNITWHILPLAAVISLVYSASRYELPARIVQRSARLLFQILTFMAIVFAVLMLLSFRL